MKQILEDLPKTKVRESAGRIAVYTPIRKVEEVVRRYVGGRFLYYKIKRRGK